jgi:hypothetical protein
MICVDSTCKVDALFFEKKHVPVITNRGFSDAFSQILCNLVNNERLKGNLVPLNCSKIADDVSWTRCQEM